MEIKNITQMETTEIKTLVNNNLKNAKDNEIKKADIPFKVKKRNNTLLVSFDLLSLSNLMTVVVLSFILISQYNLPLFLNFMMTFIIGTGASVFFNVSKRLHKKDYESEGRRNAKYSFVLSLISFFMMSSSYNQIISFYL